MLADADHAIAEKYGVWSEKKLFGLVSHGVKRTTFIIDQGGIIRKVYENVKVEGHSAEILAFLDQMQKNAELKSIP